MTSYLGHFCQNELCLSVIFYIFEKRKNLSSQWYQGWQYFHLITMVTLAFYDKMHGLTREVDNGSTMMTKVKIKFKFLKRTDWKTGQKLDVLKFHCGNIIKSLQGFFNLVHTITYFVLICTQYCTRVFWHRSDDWIIYCTYKGSVAYCRQNLYHTSKMYLFILYQIYHTSKMYLFSDMMSSRADWSLLMATTSFSGYWNIQH